MTGGFREQEYCTAMLSCRSSLQDKLRLTDCPINHLIVISYNICSLISSICFLATPVSASTLPIQPTVPLLTQLASQATVEPHKPILAVEVKGKEAIKYKVDLFALNNGIDPVLLNYIVDGESGYDPTQKGDLTLKCKSTGKAVYARGLLQITRCFHPEISDAQAFDLDFSLNWALPLLKNEASCKREWTVCRRYYAPTLLAERN